MSDEAPEKLPSTHHSTVHSLHYSEIFVDDRIRSDPKDVKNFAALLLDEGQQNPITYEVIEKDGKQVKKLNTGFRRLFSSMLLEKDGKYFGMGLPEGSPRRVAGLGNVLARDIGELDEIERLRLELSENDARAGFSESEQALGYAKLRKLMEDKSGKKVGIAELAQTIKKSVGQVGMGIKVATAINSDPTSELSKLLVQAPSVKSAYQTLQSTKKLSDLRARAALIHVKQDDEIAIDHVDGIEFLKGLDAESVDFVNFDPPWGIAYDEFQRQDKHDRYDDSEEYAWKSVIKPMVPELFRVMKTDTWGIAWCGIQFASRMVAVLEKAGFVANAIPHIWYKDNKAGSTGDSSKTEHNVYESYIRFRKGDPRLFKKPNKNVLIYSMDLHDEREHSAQKPVELSIDILERYTFSSMFCIDPTYGSGRFFKACKKLGRRFAGAELAEENREKAINLLRRVD